MLLRSGLALALLLASVAVTAAPATLLVEQTYRRAEPGQRAALIAFIRANWFAMDRVAVSQGLLTSYSLFEGVDSDADWDIVVAVGYPNAAGYADPATMAGFDAIRARHMQVLIDGKDLKALGRIVRHHRLKPID